MSKIQTLTCCCCGEHCKGERGTSEADIKSLYGVEGVHFNPVESPDPASDLKLAGLA